MQTRKDVQVFMKTGLTYIYAECRSLNFHKLIKIKLLSIHQYMQKKHASQIIWYNTQTIPTPLKNKHKSMIKVPLATQIANNYAHKRLNDINIHEIYLKKKK